MATLTSKYGLVEQAKRLDPDGSTAKIVEVLDREMGMIFNEAPWLPSNDTWVNKTTRRATLPVGERRRLNAGVGNAVSRTTEVMDVIEMVGIFAQFDKDYINSFPDAGRQRFIEAKAFIEGLGQGLVSDILYCDSNVESDGMHGFAPRLGTLDGEYVISGGGSGGTSVYVVTWGENEAFLAYPKNMSEFGISHQDMGEGMIDQVEDDGTLSGKKYLGYTDYFQFKCGLVVKNPKCLGRVCNITPTGDSNTFNEDLLITLLENMKVNENTRIYCNQSILTQARIKLKDKTNVHWAPEQGLSGLPFMSFDGIPVRKIDKDILLNTESEVE